MKSYGPLARWYDELTDDVPYEEFADYFEVLFASRDKKTTSVLDLACGTGTLARILAERGYDVTAVDSSPEMLARAADKLMGHAFKYRPLLLCQDLSMLDLYGTVEAAVSSLDSFNYVPPEELAETFRRLGLFVEPGGLLAFDILSPGRLASMSGRTFCDEKDGVFCVWRAEFETDSAKLIYGIDVFTDMGELWRRDFEEHVEYAHEPGQLAQLLIRHGFVDVQVREDGPQGGEGRLFITAIRG